MLGLLLGACASAPAGPSSAPASRPSGLPPGHPPVRARQPPTDPADEGPALDAPGPLAERWRRPYTLFDGRTGARLDDADLDRRIAAARVIYAAETHDDPTHHQVQLELVDRARRLGTVGIGLEMVQRPYQAALDAYRAGGDEAALVEGTRWAARWGYDFRLYRPLFRYAFAQDLPLTALNARKELTQAIARDGLEALDPALAADLPELDLSHVAHRARLRLVWSAHVAPHRGLPFEAFYAAQVTWDETMADAVVRTLTAEGAPERLVVLAGSGHVRYHEGIPQRVARRGVAPGLSVLPMERDDALSLIGSGVADVLWVFDR